jgi:hypothetical protein
VARRRAQWKKYQGRLDPTRLVFIDETWAKTNMTPIRGWQFKMRFLPDGPIIPSDLLTQRNEGSVIFFCGAGTSRRAGLPDFAGLAQKVVDKLGAEAAPNALERGTSSDRVSSLLVREFGQSEIDREIHSALKAESRQKACHVLSPDNSRSFQDLLGPIRDSP